MNEIQLCEEVEARLADLNLGDCFMALYRHSTLLVDQMDEHDAKEIFLGVLPGASDITHDLLDELCRGYHIDLDDIVGGR